MPSGFAKWLSIFLLAALVLASGCASGAQTQAKANDIYPAKTSGTYYSADDINQSTPLGDCSVETIKLDIGYNLKETYYNSQNAAIGYCTSYSGPGASGGWKGGCSPKSLEQQLEHSPFRRAMYFCVNEK